MSGITFFTSIKWKYLISSIFILLISFKLNAQVIQPVRYEIELENQDEQYYLTPAGKNHLILLRKKEYSGNKLNLWEFIKLDHELNEQWKKQILLNRYLQFKKQCYNDDYVLFLFNTFGSFNFNVISLNLKTGQKGHFTINNHVPLDITEFELTPHGVVIGGSYNKHPAVLYYNFDTSSSFFLPNIFSVEGQLDHINIDHEGNIDVLTSGIDHLKRKSLYLYSFNTQGKMVDQQLLSSSSSKKSLQSGKILQMKNHKLITGTYGRKRSEFSQGIFIADISEDNAKVKFYNYADLSNFFSYLKKKRIERINSRISRRREAGKPVKFKYRLLINDVIKSDGEYILIGESFYPKYKSYGTYYALNGRSGDLFFDGYYYSHAIVFGVNPQGQITWNNSMRIADVKKQTLGKVVNIAIDNSGILMAYNFKNELKSKVIRRNNVIEEINSCKINLKHASDEVKISHNNDSGGILRIGDNLLYAFGIQNIINENGQGVKYSRDVFFINKVIYK